MKSNSITNYIGTGMLALCATVGQAWMVSAARAAEAPAQRSIHISVSDLDLAKSTDVATLYERIKIAAKNACGPDFVTGSRLASASKTQCVAQAVDGAVVQINNPRLSAYHRQETTKAGV